MYSKVTFSRPAKKSKDTDGSKLENHMLKYYFIYQITF